MDLERHYQADKMEPLLQAFWQEAGVYHFELTADRPLYAIDTPPPTVSGHLHLGHTYSYAHADFIARFRRMQGANVFYPMGYDDNGLPTERLVEKRLGVTAAELGREAFIEKCLQVSEQAEDEYQQLWQRLGLSIDWRYTYRTIDEAARRISQWSFIELYHQGRVYRSLAPAIWCPECQTAIAQAELEDRERQTEYVVLAFQLEDDQGAPGQQVPIATTRPELLPACVALFVHPDDERYTTLVGRSALVPLYGQRVPVLTDQTVDRQKGSGVVMCCTFGDTTDVAWWRTYHLELVEAIDQQGRMTAVAGALADLPVGEARRQIKATLAEQGLLLSRYAAEQSVRVHERCDTPVETILAPQWFIKVLDRKEELLAAGARLQWRPAHMQARYRAWVENLSWDWCISRQRYFGVPFPVWYCAACGEPTLAGLDQLPIDPLSTQPGEPCPKCGGEAFEPEGDVLDTWATSSMTPQIVGQMPEIGTRPPGHKEASGHLYHRVFPFSLRPQAHEIIRTWAFYTIVKSLYHFDCLPWQEVLISGWGIAGEGMGKISKSRGGGPMSPMEMIQRYSADAVRYWAASTAPGKDSVISEDKIQLGTRLTNKLWNVARFSQRFLVDYVPGVNNTAIQRSAADRWILNRLHHLIQRVTGLMETCEYATAKSEIETFFWTEFCDNYLEMCKARLYASQHPGWEGGVDTLYHSFLAIVKLFAPFLPYVSEAIYQPLFREKENSISIHRAAWPAPEKAWSDPIAEAWGEALLAVASAARRYKSRNNLALGTPLPALLIHTHQDGLAAYLQEAESDLRSVTRATEIIVPAKLPGQVEVLHQDEWMTVALGR